MTILSLKSEETVVLNDTVTPTNKKVIKSNTHSDFVGRLSELCDKREEWEQNAYRTSNEGLYAILAVCLDIYQQLKGTSAKQIAERKKLTTALKEAGLTSNGGTHLTTKIVRYVFRSGKHRTSVYSRVIACADEHYQDASSLPKWISENGGIEEIRRKSKDGFGPADLNEAYKDTAENHYFYSKEIISPFKSVEQLEPSNIGTSHYAVALLRKNADGTLSIVYGTNTEAIISFVLLEAGKKLVTKQQIIDKENERRNRKELRSDLLCEAV